MSSCVCGTMWMFTTPGFPALQFCALRRTCAMLMASDSDASARVRNTAQRTRALRVSHTEFSIHYPLWLWGTPDTRTGRRRRPADRGIRRPARVRSPQVEHAFPGETRDAVTAIEAVLVAIGNSDAFEIRTFTHISRDKSPLLNNARKCIANTFAAVCALCLVRPAARVMRVMCLAAHTLPRVPRHALRH